MKPEYEQYLTYALLIVIVLVLSYTGLNLFNGSAVSLSSENKEEIQAVSGAVSGTTNSGDVSIELILKSFVNDYLVLEMKVNTHTVDLTQYDLSKIATLEYNRKKIMPYTAPKLTGHHTNGEIVFKIEEKISDFKVIINGIPLIDERIFKLRI